MATKVQQQSRGQLTSFIILTFTLTPTKLFNPPSVVSATGKETQHNISGLSRFFENLQSVINKKEIDTPKQFLLPNPHQQQPPPCSKNISSSQPSLSLLSSQLSPNSSPFYHCCKTFKCHFQLNLAKQFISCLFKNPKTRSIKPHHTKHFTPQTQTTKMSE